MPQVGVEKVDNTSNTSNMDWRRVHPGSKLKLHYILENQQFTDVTFHVGIPPENEEISGHRVLLSMHSPVFEAMFQGPLAAKEGEVIRIPDISPFTFNSLLKFLYTGDFEVELSTEKVINILYAARKYDITDLELVCTNHLRNVLMHSNAVTILQTAEFLDLPDLKGAAYAYITKHSEEICKSEDFLNMSIETLVRFVQEDDISCAEMDLFFAVLRWAESQCIRKELEASSGNMRIVAKDAFLSVRFQLMDAEDFALRVVPTEVLCTENCTVLLQHFCVSDEKRQNNNTIEKRNGSLYFARFYEEMAMTEYVDLSSGYFNKFSVDHPVSIVSFGFYGPFNTGIGRFEVSIKLQRDSDEEVLGELTNETAFAHMKEIFHVKFPSPIEIYPRCTYRAWFSLKGPLTCHADTSLSEILVPVNCSKYDHVRFTYSVTGAHQLPEIVFII